MLTYTTDIHGKGILLDSINAQVMMAWEKPYMEACIDKLQPKGDVLEIGFGMGYSATQIQKYNPKSYTIVECDPTVIKTCEEWAKDYNNVTIIESKWQDVICTDKIGKYNEVFFDDFPNDARNNTETSGCMEGNRFNLFLQFMQHHHLKIGSKISCYLCMKEGSEQHTMWVNYLTTNPAWKYQEDIINIDVSDLQTYHKSNNSAIVPLLTLQ